MAAKKAVDDSPKGAVVPSAGTPGLGSSGNRSTPAPKGVNEEVWAEAERQWRNQGGGAGVDEEGRVRAVQGRYDQMVENDRQVKKWAGDDSAILGDV